ncbi:hypothetical protein AC1031_019524 [Aphanomyces cochlioides]|nr:hypothetical protein AC1031_019524 [Aphanomyces cochlioides]
MQERTQQKQVLGTWLEQSFASGQPRSISDAIHYCSLHIDGFTDKKLRSQRAWVSRAIRSLDLDDCIMRSKPAMKKPKTLEDDEREVSEILIQMRETPIQPPPQAWCPPLLPQSMHHHDGPMSWSRVEKHPMPYYPRPQPVPATERQHLYARYMDDVHGW